MTAYQCEPPTVKLDLAVCASFGRAVCAMMPIDEAAESAIGRVLATRSLARPSRPIEAPSHRRREADR